MKYLITISRALLLLSWFVSSMAFANINNSVDDFLKTVINNDQYAHQKLNKKILQLYNQQYSAYKIYEFCQADFTRTNNQEYLLLAINVRNGASKYILFIDPSLTGYEVLNYLDFTTHINDSKHFISDGPPNIDCGTSKQIKSFWDGAQEPFMNMWKKKPSFKLGYFCLTDFKSSYNYSCYAFNKNTGKFDLVLGQL